MFFHMFLMGRIEKIWKKLEYHNGFLSYQQDSTVNLAHPAALFCPDSKKPEQFCKTSSLNDKINQNINFAKLPSAKWLFFVNCIIQKLKFCKITQLFSVSVSLVKDNLRGLREFVFSEEIQSSLKRAIVRFQFLS